MSMWYMGDLFVCSSRRLHTRCALVTGVQTCALPISRVYEEEVCVDETLEVRLNRAMQEALGVEYAHVGAANQAIIGFPDDGSWKSSAHLDRKSTRLNSSH